MKVVNELIEMGFNLSVVNGDVKLESRGSDPPDSSKAKPLLEELKQNKEQAIKHIRPLLFESLFNDFVSRMNQYPDWSIDMPAYVKTTNPSLYAEWTELEYKVDERWGMEDMQGFVEALRQYETLCLQILNEWRRWGKRKN